MATTKINTKTMLKYEDLTTDVTISSKGVATDATGKVLLKNVSGIYSDTTTGTAGFDNLVNTTATKIKSQDLLLVLKNGKTVTVEGYFTNNSKSTFKYVVDKDSVVSNLIDEAFIVNKNLLNEYNLATNHSEDGLITKTTITGTSFNDTIDLSGFSANQLKTAKGADIKSLTINAGAGNDTITGSIVNDVITGGAGENTLDYTYYLTNNVNFGADTYKTTKSEDLVLTLGATDDDYGVSQVEYSKSGNNIQVKVYGKAAEEEDVEYQKTVVSGDTTATKYTKVVTEGDTTAMKFTKEVVEANSTAEASGENKGKYKKVTKLYVRNAGNTDWELAADQPADTYEDSVVATDTKFLKYTNGTEETLAAEPTDFSDEGKFNKTVKTYLRNADNSDWADTADSTTPSKVDAAVTALTKYGKSVNGEEATYQNFEYSSYADSGKFNQVTTVSNYEYKAEELRDLEDSDLVTGLSVIDNEHVKRVVTTTDLTTELQSDGYTVNEDYKLYKAATYRNITAEDLKEGLIFVDQTKVKDSDDGEARDLTANDFKDDIKWVSGKGIETAAEVNRALTAADLVLDEDVWTLTEDAKSVSRALNTTTDLTTEAQAIYKASAKQIIKVAEGYYWVEDKDASGSSVVDAAVTPDTSYKRFVTIGDETTPSVYTWDDDNKPTDMGTHATGKTIVDTDNVLGTITLNTMGSNNSYANVLVEGNDLFEQSIYIDGTKGGKIAGTKANDVIELGTKAATLTATEGYDTVYTDASSKVALTYTDTSDYVQNFVDNSLYNVNGTANSFSYSDMNDLSGASFVKTTTTFVDKSKAKYTVAFSDTDLTLKAKTNNVVVADSGDTTGLSVSTNSGNDVVFFKSASADVYGTVVENTTDLTGTKLVWDSHTLKYEKVTAQEAEYRDITAEDLKEGLVFVDQTKVKDNADSEARDLTAGDIKTELIWVSGKGIETKAAVAQVLETLTAENAEAAINGVSSFAWNEGSIKTFTENVNKISYTGGYDAYQGSDGKEEYDIITMNKNSNLVINDLGGSDLLNFANQNFSDMTIFFNVESDGTVGDYSELSIISNDVAKASNTKSLLALFNGTGKGAVVIENYFDDGSAAIINTDKTINDAAKGDGYIEQVKVAGGTTAASMDAQVAQIAQNVATWLANNGNYDSAMDVVNAGNATDIQSLMQCYTAGTTSAIA